MPLPPAETSLGSVPAGLATDRRAGLTWWRRATVGLGLLFELRRHDFRAARTFVRTNYAGRSFVSRWSRFVVWALRQTFVTIPDMSQHVDFTGPISKVPLWLMRGNPLANHPWQDDPQARLPESAEVVVIGAGFTGGACAYHWSKTAPASRPLVVLEMDDPASGSSGRNEGLVVMGRYFQMVHGTVLDNLSRVRPDLTEPARDQLARQFAAAYCRAAYKNADLIEETIRTEGFDCDYAREGWVQARDSEQQPALTESVRLAAETGFADWTSISPDDVFRRTGMHVRHNAGFSLAAASFHPAKWVWSLLGTALRNPNVRLFTRTRVLRVEDAGDKYHVHTNRGTIRATHVINATEAYTPMLHRLLHNVILPTQTQAAAGDGGPAEMKPQVGISATWFFCGRHDGQTLFGSDATRVGDNEAGKIQPSRFLTKFLCGEMRRYFGDYRLTLTNEWSGTVGFTPDEFPIVGLMDGKRQYVIGGMCGSGTGVSFNAARCICNRIIGVSDAADDYPAEYFSPTRLIDPQRHVWPRIEFNGAFNFAANRTR